MKYLGKRLLLPSIAFGYVAAWLLTYLIGAPQVRQLTLARQGVDPSWVEVQRPHEGFAPQYVDGAITHYCDVVSYVPFVLTVRYGVTLSDEGGSGATALHFWLGRAGAPVYVYEWAV